MDDHISLRDSPVDSNYSVIQALHTAPARLYKAVPSVGQLVPPYPLPVGKRTRENGEHKSE